MNENIERMLKRYQTKTKADAERALREIIQEIILVGLWRGHFFDHAAFYGGTALRILYGLDRFSEDLDFTLTDNKHPFRWSTFEKNVVEELAGFGFNVNFEEKKKPIESEIQSAFLKTNTLNALLLIGLKDFIQGGVNPDALIRIKVEIDSNPTLGFSVEQTYLRDPFPVSIKVLKEPSLFAGKTHAALYRAWKNRVKGRDFYDLIWFLRRDIPLDPIYLKSCMISGGTIDKDEILTVEKVKDLLKKRVTEINLNEAKEDVKPFIRNQSELDLWSIDFFHHWINKLKFEN